MSILKLENVTKVYPGSKRKEPDVLAVDNFSLDVKEKEFIVFVGPSGCGKSTTLRMIAGLEEITKGKLYIHDELVNSIEPKYRNIAMVFQNYALYPHMTAYQNMAFGLKNMKVPTPKLDKEGKQVVGINKKMVSAINDEIRRINKQLRKLDEGDKKLEKLKAEEQNDQVKLQIEKVNNRYDFAMRPILLSKLDEAKKDLEYFSTTQVPLMVDKHLPKEEIDKKIKDASKVLCIEELLYKKPKNMSGGQRQRVALGRAIVRTPKLFLLDEPLSNLDAKLRAQMRVEITNLYNKLNTTFVYVTHDQVEAMTMGTRIVVMRKGVVQQIDTPTNLYDYPANRFVAGFLGTPQMNFFEAEMKSSKDKVNVKFANQDVDFKLKDLRKIKDEFLDEKEHKVIIGIRSEDISLDLKGSYKAYVKLVEPLGSETLIYADFAKENIENAESSTMIVIKCQERASYKIGDEISFSFNNSKIHLFEDSEEKGEPSIMEN